MIDLYYRTTPNGHKITMFLEEAALPYRIIPVNVGKDEQRASGFNDRIPAIVDHSPVYGCLPLSLFESGAILLYLADKSGSFIPPDVEGRMDALEWVFGQRAGFGQMASDSPEQQPAQQKYGPVRRYCRKISRGYGILDKHLADREYLADNYSIADISCYPWIVTHEHRGPKLDNYPHLNRWFQSVRSRPATRRAYAVAQEFGTHAELT